MPGDLYFNQMQVNFSLRDDFSVRDTGILGKRDLQLRQIGIGFPIMSLSLIEKSSSHIFTRSK